MEIHGMNCDGDRNETVEMVNAVEYSGRPRTMLLWLMVAIDEEKTMMFVGNDDVILVGTL